LRSRARDKSVTRSNLAPDPSGFSEERIRGSAVDLATGARRPVKSYPANCRARWKNRKRRPSCRRCLLPPVAIAVESHRGVDGSSERIELTIS